MEYSGSSYHFVYQNYSFDSALEFSWYLFFEKIKISNNVVCHPLDNKLGLNWYPDLRFTIIDTKLIYVFAEIKPLSKDDFLEELEISKYKYENNLSCILGRTNKDFMVLSENLKLKEIFEHNVVINDNLWKESYHFAYTFASQYGSNRQIDRTPRTVKFGKYKDSGLTFEELEKKDPKYYKWCEENDMI
jgi:hypothetical protein